MARRADVECQCSNTILPHSASFTRPTPSTSFRRWTGRRNSSGKPSKSTFPPITQVGNHEARQKSDAQLQSDTSRFADFDPSRASRFGRGGRLLVTARDNGSIVRKEIFDDIAYLDFLVHNISIEWKGQRLQYRDICSTWSGKCWQNEVKLKSHSPLQGDPS